MTGPSPTPARDVDAAIASVEAELSTLFRRVRAMTRSYAERVHPELTAAGYTTLSALERRGPISSGALAELLETDKSTLSRQITALDRLGLLSRAPDPADGRSTILSVTPATAERLRELRGSDQAQLHEELRGWPDGEVDQLARLLHRITALEL